MLVRPLRLRGMNLDLEQEHRRRDRAGRVTLGLTATLNLGRRIELGRGSLSYDRLMKAVAEIQVVPIGVGVSVRAEVRRAQDLIRESGLVVQEHSFGTNVEGDLKTILQVVARIHEVLHAEGTTRLSTAIKLGTRADKEPNLASKLR